MVYILSVHKGENHGERKNHDVRAGSLEAQRNRRWVAESGDTYVVSKRQKPRAVIIGIDRYRELSGTAKHLKNVGGKKIFKLGGIGKAVGDIDKAIRELRKSRIEAVTKKFS